MMASRSGFGVHARASCVKRRCVFFLFSFFFFFFFFLTVSFVIASRSGFFFLLVLDRRGYQRQGGEAGGQQRRLRHRAVPLPQEAHAGARTLGLPSDVQGMVLSSFVFRIFVACLMCVCFFLLAGLFCLLRVVWFAFVFGVVCVFFHLLVKIRFVFHCCFSVSITGGLTRLEMRQKIL